MPEQLTWAVGVTTAPREPATIRDMLVSLNLAGWDDFHVFPDHQTNVAACDLLPSGNQSVYQVHREPIVNLGPYLNFLNALRVLVHECEADAYLLLQDDVRLSVGLRDYLESDDHFHALLASDDDYPPGVISLYCAAPNHHEPTGWHELETMDRMKLGALAYVFSAAAAREFVDSPPNEVSSRGTDYWIARWCKKNARDFWTHSPSFVMHTGEVSAMAKPGGVAENRQCKNFWQFAGDLNSIISLTTTVSKKWKQ